MFHEGENVKRGFKRFGEHECDTVRISTVEKFSGKEKATNWKNKLKIHLQSNTRQEATTRPASAEDDERQRKNRATGETHSILIQIITSTISSLRTQW